MCELYAISSAVAKNISFSLCEFRRHGGDTGTHVDGWGLAYFDSGSVDLYREAEPAALSLKMDDVLQHHKPADQVISHIRKATQGKNSLENTQPFLRAINGVNHVFAHNGNLVNPQKCLPLKHHFPEGETDSEHAFCYLLEQLEQLNTGSESFLENKIATVEKVFNQFAKLGQANFLYSDGDYLFAFGNERKQLNGKIEAPGLHYLTRHNLTQNNHIDPSTAKIAGITMADTDKEQVLLASVPLTDENWRALDKNQLIVSHLGKIVYKSMSFK